MNRDGQFIKVNKEIINKNLLKKNSIILTDRLLENKILKDEKIVAVEHRNILDKINNEKIIIPTGEQSFFSSEEILAAFLRQEPQHDEQHRHHYLLTSGLAVMAITGKSRLFHDIDLVIIR